MLLRTELTVILGVSVLRIFPTLRRLDDRWGVSGSAMTEAQHAVRLRWMQLLMGILMVMVVVDGG